MFEFLCKYAVQQVAGAFDVSFWKVDFLRATQSSPALWHASLALAAVTARMQILSTSTNTSPCNYTGQAQKYYTFALSHYNKSIQCLVPITQRCLTSGLTYRDQETLLLANILFIGICCTQDDLDQAMHHAHNNSKLFNSWKFWQHVHDSSASSPSSRGLMNADSLLTLMNFFDYQLVNSLESKNLPMWSIKRDMISCSATPFQSIVEAYFEFQSLLTGLLEIIGNTWTQADTLQGPLLSKAAVYVIELGVWQSKYKSFRRSLTAAQIQANAEGIAVLSLMYTVVEGSVGINPSGSQMAYDDRNHLFRRLADQGEELYQQLVPRVHRLAAKTALVFSPSLSVVGLFFFAGIKCRDAATRRRFILLLEEWPRREGLWNNRNLARLCQFIVFTEEHPGHLMSQSGSRWIGPYECQCVPGALICDNHRVCHMETSLGADGQVLVTLRTVGDSKMGLPGNTETVAALGRFCRQVSDGMMTCRPLTT
ncbi:hypothetical protein ED733_008520 [Metarhizium rileyi]|uniref:C6 zinc finger domain protein n=1 Tax=Metarhizium rileyi (strain RCEF 4871) TaxID=1649241 RepID=A0A5C6GLS2_METRR|nr:hypothetical protein ED733_008520 [Metarhizium rileyi]